MYTIVPSDGKTIGEIATWDNIVMKGYISSLEVESSLNLHPAVLETSVVVEVRWGGRGHDQVLQGEDAGLLGSEIGGVRAVAKDGAGEGAEAFAEGQGQRDGAFEV